MPKETFFNLSNAKKQRIDDLLLEIFCSQHISQVKVSEIVDKIGMSRGAFYKYFQDLEDAYLYTIKSSSHIVHQDILKFISENKQHFFLGIEKYLEWCCDLDHESIYWQRLYLLTQRNDQQTTKRRELSADSPMNKKMAGIIKNQSFLHSIVGRSS
ncbi:transcriptional regulator [Enterococcus faecium E1679]|nr:transcriptional regulator [Enterococcus faecium E1679]